VEERQREKDARAKTARVAAGANGGLSPYSSVFVASTGTCFRPVSVQLGRENQRRVHEEAARLAQVRTRASPM
jgi:hypothetical protein